MPFDFGNRLTNSKGLQTGIRKESLVANGSERVGCAMPTSSNERISESSLPSTHEQLGNLYPVFEGFDNEVVISLLARSMKNYNFLADFLKCQSYTRFLAPMQDYARNYRLWRKQACCGCGMVEWLYRTQYPLVMCCEYCNHSENFKTELLASDSNFAEAVNFQLNKLTIEWQEKLEEIL